MKRNWVIQPCLMLVCCINISAQQTGKWGDQADGTYRNPVIAGDYSDPDVIRVAGDYYMVTSTFQLSPGVQVLHSRDLVNWRTIGAAFSDVSVLGPNFNWDKMNNYNNGVYAPTIRYHAGKFWVFVNCFIDEGFWMATADDPAGPWKETQLKDRNGKPLRLSKWTDPCPFWDDDGRAYLGCSKPGGMWYSYLFQMTPDGTQLLDADVDSMKVLGNNVIKPWPYHGTVVSPVFSSEGNKIYKENGYYYLVHIEFLGQGTGSYILRSKNLWGTKPDGTPGKPGDPGTYEKKQFAGPDDLPGQGAFVNTPEGKWYWIGQFNRMGSDGRPPVLLPVTWTDGWPMPGINVKKEGWGKMAWQIKKPANSADIIFPQGSDEFNSVKLHPQWQWNYQPRADKWSLARRKGHLRLYAFNAVEKAGFFQAGNTISQRHLRSDSTTITIKIDISNMASGQQAGIARFNGGKQYGAMTIHMNGLNKSLAYEENGKKTKNTALPKNQKWIYLRTSANFNDTATFQYSLDGKRFSVAGDKYILKPGNYRGDMVGVFTYNNAAIAGYIDIDWFHYEIINRNKTVGLK